MEDAEHPPRHLQGEGELYSFVRPTTTHVHVRTPHVPVVSGESLLRCWSLRGSWSKGLSKGLFVHV